MEEVLHDEPNELPVDMWLYGAHQPLRIGSADTDSTSSSSSFSSMSFLAKLEAAQERRHLRKAGIDNLLRQASGDFKGLRKTADFRATLDAARLRLERIQETGSSTVLELSLTGSDMMWLPVSRAVSSKDDTTGGCTLPGWILVIAPKATFCREVEQHLGKAWVFCVGSCSVDKFHEALFSFGSAGAIREDFEETFDSDDAIGLELRAEPEALRTGKMRKGFRFAGKSEVVAVELADETNLHRQLGILALLHTHPNIVKFHGAFYQPEGDMLMLTFQHAPRDLATRIQLVGALEQSRSVEVLFGVLRGVAFLHSRRTAHRDLQPRAIRLGLHNQVAIAGFDAAVGIDDHDAMRTLAGTPGYVAPEQISRLPYGVKVDVFSVGAIYFNAVTGEEPFRDAHDDDDACALKRTLEGKVDFDKPKFKMIQYTLQFLVKAMLHHSPRARPSAADAAADCSQFLSSAQTDSFRLAIDLEKDQGDDTVSRSSSLNSVVSGALAPESVLEQQARLPSLEVLEEATSSQERSSQSSPQIRFSSRSNSSAKSSPEESSPSSPVVFSVVENSQMPQQQELPAARNVEDPARSRSLVRDQVLAAESDAPDPVSAATPVPVVAQVSNGSAVQQPRLHSSGASRGRPAQSWPLSSWPLRALSEAADRARQAGHSLRHSMRNRRRGASRVSNIDDLSPLVPQDGVAVPEPMGRQTRPSRVQPQ